MIPEIRIALESAINSFPNVLPTAFENGKFDPTTSSSGPDPYQICDFMPSPTMNPTIGGGVAHEYGIMQLSLMYPAGEGSGDADAMVSELRSFFSVGSTFVANGVKVIIGATPSNGKGRPDGNRWMVPVLIPYFAYIEF